MKNLFGLALACTLAFPALAQESTRESVEELLQATNADSVVDNMYAQTDAAMANMAQELGITAAEQESFNNYMSRVSALMRQEMSWDRMREPIIDIYLKHYTEKEIQDMLAFYKTETGQSMVSKMPVVINESMQLTQQMLQNFMPKLMVLIEEYQVELQAMRQAEQVQNN